MVPSGATNRRSLLLVLIFAAVLNLFLPIKHGEAMTAEEKGFAIAERSEKSHDGYIGDYAQMEMVLIDAYGQQTVRKVILKSMETKDDGDKTIIKFIWPKAVNDTKLLIWGHKHKNDDQWLFLPSSTRVKRISSRKKTGSFMGSEFSFEDLEGHELEKFTYRFIQEDTYNDRPVWIIERYPVNKGSNYSKHKVWMDQEYLSAVKVDYFDRKGDLLKTATYENYRQYHGFWRMDTINMLNHQTSKMSRIEWKNLKLKVAYNPEDFKPTSLGN